MKVNWKVKTFKRKMSEINAKQKKWYISLPSQLKTRLSSVFVAIWRVQRSFFFVGEIVAIVIGVGSGGVFKLTQSASGDIDEFVERRNVDVLMGEIWDDSECCDWMVEDRAVELGDNVGATLVLRYDYEWTEVSHTHLAIEGFLDSGISDEDEVADCEVVLDDGGSMLLFEMDRGFDSSSVHIGGKCCQVRPTFLQGDSVPSNEVG